MDTTLFRACDCHDGRFSSLLAEAPHYASETRPAHELHISEAQRCAQETIAYLYTVIGVSHPTLKYIRMPQS